MTAAAAATVPAAFGGLPVFPIPHHAPDDQTYKDGQRRQNKYRTHSLTSYL